MYMRELKFWMDKTPLHDLLESHFVKYLCSTENGVDYFDHALSIDRNSLYTLYSKARTLGWMSFRKQLSLSTE
jgi:hypothetical protein